MISLVLPTYNEMNSGFVQQICESLRDYPEIEKIAVDRSSTDGTVEFLKSKGFQVLTTTANSRAARLNIGIEKSQGQLIVLNHPRSVMPGAAFKFLSSGQFNSQWGGFTHSFDSEHFLLQFTSWYSNFVRRKYFGVLYLDHCLVIRRDLMKKLEKPYLPEVDIFEDTLLSYKLKKIASPKLIPIQVKTSSVRFLKNGIWKQAIFNQLLKAAFHLGLDPLKMNALYEKGLGLNSKY